MASLQLNVPDVLLTSPRVTLHMSVFPCQQREHQGVLQAEEAREKKGSEEQRVEEGGGGVLWWLWDAFLGACPEVKKRAAVEKTFRPFSLSLSYNPFSHFFFPLEYVVTQGPLLTMYVGDIYHTACHNEFQNKIVGKHLKVYYSRLIVHRGPNG